MAFGVSDGDRRDHQWDSAAELRLRGGREQQQGREDAHWNSSSKRGAVGVATRPGYSFLLRGLGLIPQRHDALAQLSGGEEQIEISALKNFAIAFEIVDYGFAFGGAAVPEEEGGELDREWIEDVCPVLAAEAASNSFRASLMFPSTRIATMPKTMCDM